MNFFNYAIKCVIRNIIYKLMKPKNLIIIVISLIIILLLSNYTSVFGYQGNDTYTDKNFVIVTTYESIVNDFINRLSKLDSSNVNYNNLMASLNQDSWNFYIYYGSTNGRDMTGGNYFATGELNIIFYNKNNPSPVVSSLDSTYFGMTTSMYNLTTSIQDYYVFDGDVLYSDSVPSSVVLPGVLLSYTSENWSNFLNTQINANSSDIVTAIEQQTNTIQEQTTAIQEQTNTIQEQTEAITSTDFDEDEVFIETNDYQVDNTTERGLFSTIFDNFNSAIYSTSVEYLSIPLYDDYNLRIPSNIVSSHLGTLTVLVNAFWYYVFGFYAFKFINNLLIKIRDGSILDGYTSSEVITSDMM